VTKSGDDAQPGQRRLFRLAVLASGSGSNLQAIIDQLHRPEVVVRDLSEDVPEIGDAVRSGEPDRVTWQPVIPGEPRMEVVLVLSDVPEAFALTRARRAGIPTRVLVPRDFASREEHDLALVSALCEAEPDLVVLAGYMRLLSPAVIRAFPYRIINLHPALLPSFPGTSAIQDALRYGVKITGVTVHFVDEGMDTGPIIAQEAVRVEEGDTEETLATRIHAVEHRLLPDTIRLFAAGRVHPPLPGSRVVTVD